MQNVGLEKVKSHSKNELIKNEFKSSLFGQRKTGQGPD